MYYVLNVRCAYVLYYVLHYALYCILYYVLYYVHMYYIVHICTYLLYVCVIYVYVLCNLLECTISGFYLEYYFDYYCCRCTFFSTAVCTYGSLRRVF